MEPDRSIFVNRPLRANVISKKRWVFTLPILERTELRRGTQPEIRPYRAAPTRFRMSGQAGGRASRRSVGPRRGRPTAPPRPVLIFSGFRRIFNEAILADRSVGRTDLRFYFHSGFAPTNRIFPS